MEVRDGEEKVEAEITEEIKDQGSKRAREGIWFVRFVCVVNLVSVARERYCSRESRHGREGASRGARREEWE